VLDVQCPIISAVNGPVWRHAELPLLADIVLASDATTFQDSAHFPNDLVPGDGIAIALLALLGWNRGRYVLLTGQALTARRAFELGLVGEVLPQNALLERAWSLAADLEQRNPKVLRYTRLIFTHQLKAMFHDLLGYGLALESLAALDKMGTKLSEREG
jgi:enoyl-CoA hydratase/carnithine racemase